MLALADAIRTRGHRVTFFLLGAPPSSIAAAGFESVPLGGSVFPSDQYQAEFQKLGSLQGRAALKHTLAIGARAAEAILEKFGRFDLRWTSWFASFLLAKIDIHDSELPLPNCVRKTVDAVRLTIPVMTPFDTL